MYERLCTSNKYSPANDEAPLHSSKSTSTLVQVLSHMIEMVPIKVEATSLSDKTASTKVEAPLLKYKSAPTNV